MSEPLAVLRVGICCPVGLDAAQTTSAIRAGVTRKAESRYLDGDFEPVVLGHLADDLLPPLTPALAAQTASATLEARMLRLAGPALQEVLSRQFADLTPPVYVAGPLPPAGQPGFLGEDFVWSLATQAGVKIDGPSSRVFADGGAGFFTAVAAARDELLAPGRSNFVVVGGVDSHCDAGRLETLEYAGRLRTSGPQDAFTPGEAAAFVILTSAAVCQRHSLAPLAWITAVGLADEADHRITRLATEGLATACSAAFASAGQDQPIRLVMAGLNGESVASKEWGVALLRNRERFADPLRVEHPAEYTGDPGAALAPLMLGTAALRMRAGLVQGPALVWARSDSGRRGALIMHGAG